MNKEEFNNPNGNKHRLYGDSCEYVAHHEHYDDNWNIVNEQVVLIKDTKLPISCYKDDKKLIVVAEHDINKVDNIDINKVDDVDYDDIYDDINDYEYPYNHVNRNDL